MMWCEEPLKDGEKVVVDREDWKHHLIKRHMKDHNIELADPASHIFSVKIVCNSFKQPDATCNVYGEINILDRDGTSYKVYCRKRDCPQTVTSKHNTLALSIPKECTASSCWKRMSFCLKNAANGTFIVDEAFSFDQVAKEGKYDKVIPREVHGIAGSAYVKYTVFSTADIAVVRISLRKKSLPADSDSDSDFYDYAHAPHAPYADYSDDDDNAHLYGRIALRYGNTYGNIFPGTLLFEKPSTESISVMSNTAVILCGCTVAAPAYCFLRIDVNLYDSKTNDLLVSGKADFPAADSCRQDVDVQSGDFVVRVRVWWFYPYLYLNKFDNADHVQDESLSSNIGRGPFVGGLKIIGNPLVEVFSVMIHTDIKSQVVDIYGEVQVFTTRGLYKLFDRCSDEPETLSANKNTISLRAPPECADVFELFLLELHLHDVKGKVMIDGLFSKSSFLLDLPISWFDRRLCSIVRGVHGYAAVFYTIFSSAVQASVQVSLKPIDSVDPCHEVYGSIVARYSVKECSSEYEQNYYQSVLLKTAKENPSELKADSIVPLLKSEVAVPSHGSLQLKVHLWAKTSGDEYSEEFSEDVGFEIEDVTPALIKGEKYKIECSVKWSQYWSIGGQLP